MISMSLKETIGFITLALCLFGWKGAWGENLEGHDAHALITESVFTTEMQMLAVNQTVRLGEFDMQITELSRTTRVSASGKGQVYLPFLEQSVDVEFYGIGVNAAGELISGEVAVASSNMAKPTFASDLVAVNDYILASEKINQLPIAVNQKLESRGMEFGGHRLILTEMLFTGERAFAEAIYLVENLNGQASVFTSELMEVNSMGLELCYSRFLLEAGAQEQTDPEFPITIKGYDASTDEGSFVAFDCEGFKAFQLEAEFRFDRDYVIPADQVPGDVIATFTITTETWGQFVSTIDFSTPFEIVGVDDVVFTISNASIDYSDTENIENFPSDYSNGVGDIWRGVFIEEVSVQLPDNFKISRDANGDYQRVELNGRNLIYDSDGFTATISSEELGIQGDLSGWGISLSDVLIQVDRNSLTEFKVEGDIHIPVTGQGDEIGYTAQFIRDASSQSLKAQFLLDVSGEYALPFLEGSEIVLAESSVVGIEVYGGDYKPFADLSGSIDVKVDDFELPALGFQGLNIPMSGIQDISFQAFSFAGIDFDVSVPTDSPGSESEEEEVSNTEASSGQGEKIKGFPISISNISFGDGGQSNGNQLKKLGFTLNVNFTGESLGIAASGTFGVFGEVDPGALIPGDGSYAPWKAFELDHIELERLSINAEFSGVELVGGVRGFITPEPGHVDYQYGSGFKGAMDLTIVKKFNVTAVALFGTTPGSGGYRYFMVDAKFISGQGVAIVPPIPVMGLYGFGGGLYYNMEQQVPSFVDAMEDNIPSESDIDALLDDIGANLSGLTYTPRESTLGFNATVILGTYPSPVAANMDLTFGLEFDISTNFGLRKVTFSGDGYVMAPILNRELAAVNASVDIIYDLTNQTITADLNADVEYPPGPVPVIFGGGSAYLHFNLQDSDDWYVAIGSPPLVNRFNLSVGFESIGTLGFNAYFVAGNLEQLPADKKTLPRLSEYHSSLARFESEVVEGNYTVDPRARSTQIMMGAQFTTGSIDERWWIFRAYLEATIGFDLKIQSNMMCDDYDEIGIDGWYIPSGTAYAAFAGGVAIYVDILFHKGWFDIFSVEVAALLQAKMPKPSWVKANIAGSYRILGGLIKGSFECEVEAGEYCEPRRAPIDPAALVANIEVIGDIQPEDVESVPVRSKEIGIIAFSQPINGVMDFSYLTDDGLQIRPRLVPLTPVRKQSGGNHSGSWRYFDEYGVEVGPGALFVSAIFESSRLMTPRSGYELSANIYWEKRVQNDNGEYGAWERLYKADGSSLTEAGYAQFTSGEFPSYFITDDILASYPEMGASSYCIPENPAGGGVNLAMDGWGPMFNPKKKIGNTIYSVDYICRVKDATTDEIVFEGPLEAVVEPAWGQAIGSDLRLVEVSCSDDTNPLDMIYDYLEMKCYQISSSGAVAYQPQRNEVMGSDAISNVGLMDFNYEFGDAYGVDLAVYRLMNSTTNFRRAIGFPDFSASLLKNREYTIDIVQTPKLNNAVSVEVTENSDDVSGDSSSISLNTTSRTISASFEDAPDNVLFSYSFTTGVYNNFIEKLQHAVPQTVREQPYMSDMLDDERVMFIKHFAATDFKGNPGDVQDNLVAYFGSALASHALNNSQVVQLKLSAGQGDFDKYELERLTANIRNSTASSGQPTYIEAIRTSYYPGLSQSRSAEVNVSFLSYNHTFGNTGTYSLGSKPENDVHDKRYGAGKRYFFKDLPAYTDLGNTDRNYLDLNYYPQLVAAFQYYEKAMAVEDQLDAQLVSMSSTFSANQAILDLFISEYNEVRNYYADLLRRTADGNAANVDGYKLPGYDEHPFVFEYVKPVYGKAKFHFGNIDPNNPNVGTPSYADYSGQYYLRTHGSEQYVRLASGNLTARGSSNNSSVRYAVNRLSDGKYEIKSLVTNQVFPVKSASGSVVGNTASVELVPSFLETGPAYSWKVGDYFIQEDYFTGKLEAVATPDQSEDYRSFQLQSSWEQPSAEVLNASYRIQGKGSDRYVRLALDEGNVAQLSTGKQVDDVLSQFQLIKRNGGGYEIRVDDRSLMARKVDGQWIHTADAEYDPTLEIPNYRFEFKKQIGASGGVSYRVVNQRSGEYLYERFDLSLPHGYRVIASTASPDNEEYSYYDFILRAPDYYVAPVDLSGNYYIQLRSNERHIYDDRSLVSTNISSEDFAEYQEGHRFELKRAGKVQATGDILYEIYNHLTEKKVHLKYASNSEGGYYYLTSELTDGSPNYKFVVNQEQDDIGEYYDIFQVTSSGNRYLTESFRLDGSSPNGVIVSTTENQGIQGGFILNSTYVEPGPDLSGQHQIVTTYDANPPRYLCVESTTADAKFKNNDATTNDYKFILNKRLLSSGSYGYEIWSAYTQQRLFPFQSTGARSGPLRTSGEPANTNQDAYLYRFLDQPGMEGYKLMSGLGKPVLETPLTYYSNLNWSDFIPPTLPEQCQEIGLKQ